MTLGDFIRYLCVHRGLTGREVADKAGITIAYVSMIKRDEKDVSTRVLRKLAETFGVPIKILIMLKYEETMREGKKLANWWVQEELGLVEK